MRALPIFKIRRIARPLLVCLAIFAGLALVSSTFHQSVSKAKNVQDRPETTQATFPANAPSLGAIPDGPGTCDSYGANRDVTFTVAGIGGTITNVEVNFTVSPVHTWVGDLDVRLIPPGGSPEHVIFSRTGAALPTSTGFSSDAGGPFIFKDAAPAAPTWWTVAATTPVAPGMYRTSTAGEVAGGGANTLITPIFAGLGAAANGTWTLRFRDHCSADVGTVSAASLTIDAGPAVIAQHIVDYDGDGKTDPSVVRNTGGGPAGQVTWFNQNSGGSPATTTTPWGIATDFFVPADYDGDNKTDIAVWRQGPPFGSFFYILQSSSGALRTDTFGQTGDDASVVGDYDGDGKEDVAVYRSGVAAGDHSFWYYRSSINGLIIGTEYGQNGDFPAPGDYDGDGKNDFCVQRNNGGGQARFFLRKTSGGDTSFVFGTPTDVIVPGDYDGDGKTDIATIRGSGGVILWNVLRSSDSVSTQTFFGASANDLPTQGDWDGDGKTDVAVWRPDIDPALNFFYIRRSGTGVDAAVEWGQNGDYPVANYNSH